MQVMGAPSGVVVSTAMTNTSRAGTAANISETRVVHKIITGAAENARRDSQATVLSAYIIDPGIPISEIPHHYVKPEAFMKAKASDAPLGYTQPRHSPTRHRSCSTRCAPVFWHMSRLGFKT